MSKIFTANFLSFLLIVQIMFIDSSWLSAQTTQSDSIKNESTVLQGLKKAGPGDIQPGTPLMLDPMSMPMYDEQFQKINPADFMKIMMSSEYIPEPYLDEKKMVKAFVLRKATLEEKAMMAKMQQGGMGMEQEKNELIGTKATDFNLKDLKGKTHILSELKGKVVVLNFWFVECKPCIMEMPELNELVEEFKEKNIVFLAIALNDKKQLKKFLKTTDFNYKVVANGQTSADSYGVKGFPTNVIIDQNGIIHYVSTGIGPNNKENLQKAINELLIK
jgi:peroxiredoxin